MTYDVDLGGRTASVSVRQHPEGGWWIAVDDGPETHVTATREGEAEWLLQSEGRTRRVATRVAGDQVHAQLADGTGITGTVVDPRDAALAALSGGGEGAVATPMPGAIVRVLVAEGDQVEEGQVLVVVEAMKMENEFKAPMAGVVAAVHVSAGTSVDAGALLVTLAEEA